MTNRVSRRRFLEITAFAGLAISAPSELMALEYPSKDKLYQWNGFALGTDASIKLYSNDKKNSDSITQKCLAEILRLEKIFSLYEPNSEISKLNKQSYLDNPSDELKTLIKRSFEVSEQSGGIFDITVQPLWSARNKNIQSKSVVDYRKIKVESNRIFFQNSGMQITLNGIAQGFITDKVTEILQSSGVDNVMVNIGELRGIGNHSNGLPWKAGIQSPQKDIIRKIDLTNKSISTSSYGGDKENIIFDANSGKPQNYYKTVSVISKEATTADALSTTIFAMKKENIGDFLKNWTDTQVIILDKQNNIISI